MGSERRGFLACVYVVPARAPKWPKTSARSLIAPALKCCRSMEKPPPLFILVTPCTARKMEARVARSSSHRGAYILAGNFGAGSAIEDNSPSFPLRVIIQYSTVWVWC